MSRPESDDPRIEVAAKAIAMGALYGYSESEWRRAASEDAGTYRFCCMAAQDVLQALDESGESDWQVLPD